jgi:hypothetical protein
MIMGDIDWNMSDQYHISIIKWKDKRGVTLLSNFHNPTDVVELKRKSRDGTTSMIPCLCVLKDYNMNMNYVDKFDQYKKMYHIDRKSHKWWHRIFFFFFFWRSYYEFSYYIYKNNRRKNNIKKCSSWDLKKPRFKNICSKTPIERFRITIAYFHKKNICILICSQRSISTWARMDDKKKMRPLLALKKKKFAQIGNAPYVMYHFASLSQEIVSITTTHVKM